MEVTSVEMSMTHKCSRVLVPSVWLQCKSSYWISYFISERSYMYMHSCMLFCMYMPQLLYKIRFFCSVLWSWKCTSTWDFICKEISAGVVFTVSAFDSIVWLLRLSTLGKSLTTTAFHTKAAKMYREQQNIPLIIWYQVPNMTFGFMESQNVETTDSLHLWK